MPNISMQQYHRIGEDKRIHIISMRQPGCSIRQISAKSKVKHSTVEAVLNKWNQHHTIGDLLKTGAPSKLDDRTKRRLARMAQSGEVSSSTDLVQTAASHDIAQISARTARNMLQQVGLKAMRMVGRPLLTRAHKRRRLEFARAHRDWTVDD
ncbi:hypothetical protein EON65_27845, partial [archaeon]